MTDAPEGKADIVEQLREIVAQEGMVDISKVTPETLLEDLEIQSADYVMILMAVEEKFGTYISVDTDFTDAKTVGDLIEIVKKKIEEGAGAGAGATA